MLEALDATALRSWYRESLAALEAAREEINSLNVFPVADSDTGTNLLLTLASAIDGDVDAGTDLAADDLAGAAASMADGALRGARGSSGVILSQLLRGLADVLAGARRPARGEVLTEALERAVELAYAAVAHPVEGTMLTVARAAAEGARAVGSDNLRLVAAAAAVAARTALASTPSQLDVLARAGVVDAGGRGIVVLFDVLEAVVAEQPVPTSPPRIAHPVLRAPAAVSPAYEVMYLIDADDERIPALRRALDAVGDSVVVSGGGGLWHVHVHTDHRSAAVAVGVAVGRPHGIRTTTLAHAGRRADERQVVVVVERDSPTLALRGPLERAGAQVVEALTPATPTSVARTFDAVEAPERVVLVETADDLPALVDTVGRTGENVTVVSFEAPVEALAAVAVHDPQISLAADAAAMAKAAANSRHAVVHRQAGADLFELACAELEYLLADGGELATVIAAPEICAQVVERFRRSRPDVEVSAFAVADSGDDSTVWLGVE